MTGGGCHIVFQCRPFCLSNHAPFCFHCRRLPCCFLSFSAVIHIKPVLLLAARGPHTLWFCEDTGGHSGPGAEAFQTINYWPEALLRLKFSRSFVRYRLLFRDSLTGIQRNMINGFETFRFSTSVAMIYTRCESISTANERFGRRRRGCYNIRYYYLLLGYHTVHGGSSVDRRTLYICRCH